MENFSKERPVPVIDLTLCDGCGLCVQACPSNALALDANNKAFVIRPMACDYSGHCEMICPVKAINRPFQIIITKDKEI